MAVREGHRWVPLLAKEARVLHKTSEDSLWLPPSPLAHFDKEGLSPLAVQAGQAEVNFNGGEIGSCRDSSPCPPCLSTPGISPSRAFPIQR